MNQADIHKELDLIQKVVERMASNSFEVKKWLIGILTALIVFKHEELMGGNSQLYLLLLLPIFCFWYLDAFFLSTERLYRNMYKWVVANRGTSSQYLFDLNTMTRTSASGEETQLKLGKDSVWNVMFSQTLWPFYIVPLAFALGFALVHFAHRHCCCC